MRRRPRVRPLLLCALLATLPGAAGAAVPRPAPVSGSVVAARGGEEIQFVREAVWRPVELRQDLLAGDVLRTGAIGNLAILFADQTQIRVGRNSVLLVKEVTGPGPTRLQLNIGNVWARAQRGGGVVIDTPSAAAAVRGTDWSLAVDAQGSTALVVMDGVVELSNPFGSVTVERGEAAFAAIGQAPSKILLVSPRDREQMLFYIGLRGAFTWLPASPLDRRAMRETRARLQAKPERARTLEDWLTLAEIALAFDGRDAAAVAARQARAFGLPPEQQARADLIEGLLAALERRWSDAVAWFDAAAPQLQGRRRATAAWARYFAAALADPDRRAPPPGGFEDEPYAALARAWLAGFLDDLEAAIAIVREAERRFPQEVILPAFRAQVALLLDRRDESRAAAERALALDPEDPIALQSSGYYKAEIESDLNGALADLRRSAAIAPGDADSWNMLGLVQDERDAGREAEAAFRQAIEADPEDPVPHANYAIFLLDRDRTEEARREIDRALELDPAMYVALAARGRYLVQKDRTAEGRDALLAAATANPAYSNALLALAVAYYQEDDTPRALQQLDNADRLDPNDPVVPLARTAIAIDRFAADEAVASAREAVRRFRARGGYYAPLAANRQAGSYLADAFRLLELNEWGRYYGDVVFDPFSAVGYFDEAIAERPDPFLGRPPLAGPDADSFANDAALSSLIQGLLLDPLSVASRSRRIDLLRRPFLDPTATAGLVARDGRLGWLAGADLQGFDNDGLPLAFFASASALDSNGRRDNDAAEAQSASLFAGLDVTPADKLLLFGTAGRTETELPAQRAVDDPDDRRKNRQLLAGAGWSHSFGYRNVLTAAAFGAYSDERERGTRPFIPQLFDLSAASETEQTTFGAAVSHLFGDGPLTVRYGAEASRTTLESEESVTFVSRVPQFPDVTDAAGSDAHLNAGRVYLDGTANLHERLQLAAGAYGTWLHGAGLDIARFEPRLGVAVMPLDGQWLRAAYRRETEFPTSLTLAPVTTLGLLPDEAPLQAGGRSETLALRWDAEWLPHLFTSVEYQRQELRGLDIAVPDTLTSVAVEKGRIERLSATANLWLDGGIGLFATVAHADSEDRSAGPRRGGDLPFVPDWLARFGASWVHPSRVKVTLAETLVGSRASDLPGSRLDGYATTDLSVLWEPFDRRLAIGLSLLNIFDADFDLAEDVPGPGVTLLGTVTARF